LRDLLVDGTDLSVAEDRHQGVVVRGLQEVPVQNLQHALEVWHHGRHQRITAATGMNDRSSRSHCIFTLHVTRDGTTSKLSIVDLAGSECVKKIFMPGKSHAANRETVEEAKAINQSLSTLGLVINRLARSKGRNIDTHVPYRSSKLTRVLQDSIGGGSRTALLLNCSISSLQVAETLSTLRFGTRARSCVNVVPTGNCEEPMLLKTLRAARQELQRLQARAWPREMDDEDDTPFSGLSALSHEQESVSIVDVEFNSPESGALRPRFVQHGLELSLVQEAEGSEENEDLPRGRQSVASGFRRSTCSRRTSRRMSRHSRQSGVMRSHPASVPTSPRWNQGLCMSSVSFCGPDGCTECWEHPLTKSEKRSRLIAILTKELSGADAELKDVQALADDLERRCEALQAETEWLRVEYGAAETTTGNPSVREMTACCAAAYVQCLTGHIAKQISGASEVLEQDLAALREETQRQDQHTAGETISKPAKGLKKLEKEKGKKMDKEQLEQTVEELQRKLEKTGVESRLQTNLLDEEKQALKEEARRQEEIIQKLQQQFNAESAGRQKAVERAEGLQKDIEKVNGKKMDKQSEADELRRQTNSEKVMQILCRSGRYAWLLRLLFVLTVWFLQTWHKEHVSASSAPDPSLGIGSDSASAPVAFYQEVQEEIALDTKQILEEEASVEERAETTPNASVDQEEPLFPYERYDGDRERQLIIPANQASTRRNTTRPSGRIHGEEMAAWSALPIFTAFASLAFGYAG